MPLSWNEIKDRAVRFSREFADDTSEDAEAKTFWDQFFNVFGVSRRRVAAFERPVKQADGKGGFIDLLWKGVLLVEHKSAGKDLDRAFGQAKDYFAGLKDRDLPRFVAVSDFKRIRLYDLDKDSNHEFALKDLHKHVRAFGFIAGYEARSYKEQDPVNIKAAERMGKLHDRLKAAGYVGQALEHYLVRLLFCLFADDAGVWGKRQFQDLIEQRTGDDGREVGPLLAKLFQTLNTPTDRRMNTLDEQLADFPYVNGKLFEERLELPEFDATMRELLLEACALDWGQISPAIFGAMFQSVMDAKARRNLGAHYTSEKNILKLVGPLFLDELRAEFERTKGTPGKLEDFHRRLAGLTFLDPACGCGNFLVITYRELRLLELEVMRAIHRDTHSRFLSIKEEVRVDVDQFYGIEIEEFPAQIAQVALWLIDHQMNMQVSEEFGEYFTRLPLTKSANIVHGPDHGNALRVDWGKVVPVDRLSYILGNPPFVGAKLMNDKQREHAAAAMKAVPNAGLLDFVAAWFVKAAQLCQGRSVQAAFVATNSISQGEQPGVLWSTLFSMGMRIHFAHRTFRWSNEAASVAAVHCVIIGFGQETNRPKVLYDYPSVDGEPVVRAASHINPYLIDANEAVLVRRSRPVSPVPEIGIGNKPIDGGFYLFTGDERASFLKEEPRAEKLFKLWIGSDEFLNGIDRWCLWLAECPPEELRSMPAVLRLVESVRQYRLGKLRGKNGRMAERLSPGTVKLAGTPTRFHVENRPKDSVLVIPRHSSEKRKYIPFGYFGPEVLVGDACLCIAEASLFHFGVLTSAAHMAWVQYVCGRIKSDYRYSATIVYNNYPWPEQVPDAHREAIESAARDVLAVRSEHPASTLADLYDPLTMPVRLLKAHEALDRAVDAAYLNAEKIAGRKPPKISSSAERVAFLFDRYAAITSLLPSPRPRRVRKTDA